MGCCDEQLRSSASSQCALGPVGFGPCSGGCGFSASCRGTVGASCRSPGRPAGRRFMPPGRRLSSRCRAPCRARPPRSMVGRFPRRSRDLEHAFGQLGFASRSGFAQPLAGQFSLFERRRPLMDDWMHYLSGQRGRLPGHAAGAEDSRRRDRGRAGLRAAVPSRKRRALVAEGFRGKESRAPMCSPPVVRGSPGRVVNRGGWVGRKSLPPAGAAQVRGRSSDGAGDHRVDHQIARAVLQVGSRVAAVSGLLRGR